MRLHSYFKVLVTAFVLLTITSLVLAWLVHRSPNQVVAGQEPTVPELTAPTTSPPAATVPELTEEVPSEPEPQGIPGLGVMDVIGNLEYFRTEGGFVCDGPAPTEGIGSIWVCSAPGGEVPGTYEVTVLGENPTTILWVAATARGVSEERSAEFFSYVASLCLQESGPLNAEAWVGQNVSSGGQVSTESAELTIYGTDEERTLQVVAKGLDTD